MSFVTHFLVIFVPYVVYIVIMITTILIAGSQFKLESPHGSELPSRGFDPGQDTYQRPPESGGQLTVKVNAGSDRLQLLTPFDKWDGNDIEDMTVLIKVTDASRIYSCDIFGRCEPILLMFGRNILVPWHI